MKQSFKLLTCFSIGSIFLITLYYLGLINYMVQSFFLISQSFITIDTLNVSLILGADGISIMFVLVSALLIFICLISFWFSSFKNTTFSFLMLTSLFCLIIIFFSLDLFFSSFFLRLLSFQCFFWFYFEEVEVVKFMQPICWQFIL